MLVATDALQLEIKAYLESVYGLKVERVNTINYLGRKYLVPSHKVCIAGVRTD